jgi:RimJ/RimL family protein N-acetyltransferase
MLCFFKNSNICIGYLKCGDINEDGYDKIDYKFSPEYWGKGYGYELVSGMIKYLYEVVKVETGIETSLNVLNIASIKVSEKCGLKLIEKETMNEYILMRMNKKDYVNN